MIIIIYYMTQYMTITYFLEMLEPDEANVDTLLTALALSEGLVDHVKINTNNWGSSSALNIHAAQYMQAVQKDVLTAWNEVTGQHVTLSNLDDYPFLLIEFEVQDGCIDIKQVIKLTGILMKDLSPTQKMFLYVMIFCAVLAISSAYTVGKLADSGYFDSDEIKKIKILSQQKESTKVLINNLGNGTINYHGRTWDPETIKKDRKSVDLVSITENIALDGIYTIDTCKLEGGIHLISKNGKQFYADYDALNENKRKILTDRVANSLLQKRKLEQQFRIDAKIKDGSIIKAHIIDIDQDPRPHTFKSASKNNNIHRQKLRQGSLLDEE